MKTWNDLKSVPLRHCSACNNSGQEYEVVDATEDDVTFETSDGVVIRMDIDDVVADIAIGALALQDGVDARGYAK